MIKVTIGQYIPGKSIMHRVDARVKVVLSIAYVTMLFVAGNMLALGIGAALLIMLYPLAKIPARLILRSLRPIIPVIIFTGLINMFFVPGNITLLQIGPAGISDRGLAVAVTMCVRIISLIAGTSLLMYTTTPITLTDALERLFSPLKALRLPVHEIAMMMTIALRFIPTLIEETDKIMSAQKARGADMESGSIIQRVKALIPVLIPLFVSAFRRADDLALAMESRCYRDGKGRTRMRQLRVGIVDLWAVLFMAGFVAAVILANLYAWRLGIFY